MKSEQAKNTSRAFHLAAARCSEARPLAGDQVQILAVPAIVCEAFSVELAFKSLLPEAMRSHDLKQLFDRLPPAHQEKIIAATNVEAQEFHSALEATAKAFDQWRYVHEKEELSISTEFLSKLAKASQQALIK